MQSQRERLLGSAAAAHAIFPWLVKFLDAQDWLSVQVHPDTETVRRLWPNEGSKTEAWFVLDAVPGSRIYAGLLPDIDETKLRKATTQGTVADCLHHFEPRAVACVFLPAGTVHAIGAGLALCEIQQHSDVTYRLYDYGRPRELHLDKAVAVAHTGAHSGEPAAMPVACQHFRTSLHEVTEPLTVTPHPDRFELFIILEGEGRIAGEPYRLGQTWHVPAGAADFTLVPAAPTRLLRTHVP